jgi:acetyltransferase-like isoleucine patch superfamily enzyme
MGVDRLCRLGDSVQIAVVGAHKNAPAVFSIGYNTHILDRTKINVSTSVTIGSECSISWDCDILDSDFHAIVDAEGQKLSVTKPIIIGDHVWIGCNSIILKGVTIQHHSIVAAGSVVTCDIPPFTLVGGNPARKIKLIHDWLRNPCDGE